MSHFTVYDQNTSPSPRMCVQNYAKNKVGYANEKLGCLPTLGDTPLGVSRLCVQVKVVCPSQVLRLLTLPLTLTTSYLETKEQP